VKKWPLLMPLLTVGFYVAFSLLIPTGIGFWFDRKASHEFPLFTLVGLGVGTVIMIYGVYRMAKPFLNQTEWSEEDERQIRQPMRLLLNLLSLRKKRGKDK